MTCSLCRLQLAHRRRDVTAQAGQSPSERGGWARGGRVDCGLESTHMHIRVRPGDEREVIRRDTEQIIFSWQHPVPFNNVLLSHISTCLRSPVHMHHPNRCSTRSKTIILTCHNPTWSRVECQHSESCIIAGSRLWKSIVNLNINS